MADASATGELIDWQVLAAAIQHLTVPYSVAVQQLQQQRTPVQLMFAILFDNVYSVTSNPTAATRRCCVLQPRHLQGTSEGCMTWQHWSGREGRRHKRAARCCTSPRLPPVAYAAWAAIHGCAPPALDSRTATGQFFHTAPSPGQSPSLMTLEICPE